MNDPRLLWWVDRSSGLVAFVLLTVVMVLGVLATGRPRAAATASRSLAQGLHRQLPLVAVVLLAVHIGTAVADSFVPIGLLDALVPFRAGYRPLWIGLGTLAFDLLATLVVTSVLRTRMRQRTWRAVHLAAYGLWPMTVVHALGSGSDMHSQTVQRVGLACVGAVVLAVSARLVEDAVPRKVRLAGIAALLCLVTVVSSWAAHGPLAPGWSKRAAMAPAVLR